MAQKTDSINFYDPATGVLSTKHQVVDAQVFPIKDEIVKIGNGKAVMVQVGPTPNEAFAVFSKNPAFHDEGPEAWDRAARMALDLWAAKGKDRKSVV